MERIYKTNYKVATKWCNNSYVMCNHIAEIDPSVLGNMRFELDSSSGDEIYQWFISDCSEWDVEFLEENFGLRFSYSDLLDCYILCVDLGGRRIIKKKIHTSCECAARELGQDK